jgi:deoxyribonuclease V
MDAAYQADDRLAFGAVTVWDALAWRVVEEASATMAAPAEYRPGFLAWRELPVLLAAFRRLQCRPDVILLDAHGRAHPCRCGLACLAGLELGMPSIGCAKSVLVGSFSKLGQARGSRAELRDGDEVIGMALRTRDGVRPVIVSVGHLVSLQEACEVVLTCSRTRIPEPLRAAHTAVTRLANELTPE